MKLIQICASFEFDKIRVDAHLRKLRCDLLCVITV